VTAARKRVNRVSRSASTTNSPIGCHPLPRAGCASNGSWWTIVNRPTGKRGIDSSPFGSGTTDETK